MLFCSSKMLLCSRVQRKHAAETHVCFPVLGSGVSGDFYIYKKPKKTRGQSHKYRKKQGRGEEWRQIQQLCEQDRLLSRTIKMQPLHLLNSAKLHCRQRLGAKYKRQQNWLPDFLTIIRKRVYQDRFLLLR